jgi:hypothetical protein
MVFCVSIERFGRSFAMLCGIRELSCEFQSPTPNLPATTGFYINTLL